MRQPRMRDNLQNRIREFIDKKLTKYPEIREISPKSDFKQKTIKQILLDD